MGAGLITPASLACLSTPLKAIYVVCVECLSGIALPTGGPAIRLKNKKLMRPRRSKQYCLQLDIALWCKNQIEHSIWDESLLLSNCARSLEYSSSSTLAGLSYHICGKLEVAFRASSSSQHQHCTDEAQKAETVLSAVNYYIYIYIYIYIDIALWCKNQIEHSIWDESLLFSNCARSLEYSSSSTLAGLSYHICGKLEVAFKGSPSSQHQHCTDEAQKAETVLSAVSYIYIYIYI